MFSLGRGRWLLFLPLVLFEPFFGLLRKLNHALWEAVRGVIGFLDAEPIFVLLILIIAFLLVTKNR